MPVLARFLWLLVHVGWSALSLAWLLAWRRRQALVLTHHHDRDAEGVDRQMGPLVHALGGRCIEVLHAPLSAASLRHWWPRPRAFVSYAALAAAARCFAPWTRERARIVAARTRIARGLLALLRPRALFLIDESGSGQPFVRAGRARGLRVVGVQHGDFKAGDAAYDASVAADVVPADVLCVWSPWFRARLLALSRIYSLGNTVVTGRLRYPSPAPVAREARSLRVLVAGEAGQEFPAAIAPWLAALRADPLVEVLLQPHPAVERAALTLSSALSWCDVAAGMRSSALLEAMWFERPVVVLGDAGSDLVQQGLATRCAHPADVADACRTAALHRERVHHARECVWGGVPPDAAAAVLAAASRPAAAASPSLR